MHPKVELNLSVFLFPSFNKINYCKNKKPLKVSFKFLHDNKRGKSNKLSFFTSMKTRLRKQDGLPSYRLFLLFLTF